MTDRIQDGFIVDIDAIQSHGIGAVDIAKLKANGYYTVASVHSATRRNLLKIKGFSEIKVDKVKDAIAKCQVCLHFMEEMVNLADVDAACWRRLPNCT